MHGDDPRKKIVHHHYANVLAPRLHTIQPIELGQQGPLVLVYILEQREDREEKTLHHLLFKYFSNYPAH